MPINSGIIVILVILSTLFSMMGVTSTGDPLPSLTTGTGQPGAPPAGQAAEADMNGDAAQAIEQPTAAPAPTDANSMTTTTAAETTRTTTTTTTTTTQDDGTLSDQGSPPTGSTTTTATGRLTFADEPDNSETSAQPENKRSCHPEDIGFTDTGDRAHESADHTETPAYAAAASTPTSHAQNTQQETYG